MVEFYVDHPMAEFEKCLFDLMVVSQRLGTAITLAGDVRQDVLGSSVISSHPPVQGLVGCSWRLRADQDYKLYELVRPTGPT